MVVPHPDLMRRFTNTDNIVKANGSHLIPELFARYPNDYVDLDTYEAMKKVIFK